MSRAGDWLEKVIARALTGSKMPASLEGATLLALLDTCGVRLSPIDRHVIASRIIWRSGLFHSSYEEWRIVRINKILEIFGPEHFKGKRILELGAGHGEIGAFFAALGAHVTCLDGRVQNVNYAKLKHRGRQNIEFHQFNLENDFSQFGRFDLIINFGLIYHLKNVDRHLECCFRASDEMLLETVVCDSLDPRVIQFCPEEPHVDEQALCGVGSRPSPAYVERIAREGGFAVERHFTRDLNVGDQFVYDWIHRNDGSLGKAWQLRRFWRLTRQRQP